MSTSNILYHNYRYQRKKHQVRFQVHTSDNDSSGFHYEWRVRTPEGNTADWGDGPFASPEQAEEEARSTANHWIDQNT